MSFIKIPSKNIFNSPKTLYFLGNEILKCKTQKRYLTNKNSDILTEPYTIYLNEFSEKIVDGWYEYVFVGNDSSINPVTFTVDEDNFEILNDFEIILRYNKLTEKLPNNMRLQLTYYWHRTWAYEPDQTLSPNVEIKRISYVTFATTLGLDYGYLSIPAKRNFWSLLEEVEERGRAISKIEIRCIYPHFEEITEEESFGKTDAYQKETFDLPYNEICDGDNSVQGTYANEFLSNEILRRYENGKEVITLKCSVSEYYDTQGELKISQKNNNLPMLFKHYDIVEPYVCIGGQDVPIKISKDGKPSLFEIIGIDFSYKGVPFQELTLQEWLQ